MLSAKLRANLKRQFFSAGEMMLFAPHFAVMFGSHFEEFISSVSRELTALVSQFFQLSGREWLEIRGDSKVPIENFHRLDTANPSCNRQTHGIAQSLLSRYASMSHHFPTAAKTFHFWHSDPAARCLWQYVRLKTAKDGVETVQRHLHRVEGKIVRQHLQVNLRILVPGESNETPKARLRKNPRVYGDRRQEKCVSQA
jgi:hypothetical protein